MPVRLLAIGTTSGATQALGEILAGLPAAFPVPVVVAHHRQGGGPEGLLERLQKQCALPIVEPDDKEELSPSRLYLAPPGYHMLVDRSCLALSVEPPESGQRPAINPLLDTAADTFGQQAVGVLLWESGEDGWAGLGSLRAAGGR